MGLIGETGPTFADVEDLLGGLLDGGFGSGARVPDSDTEAEIEVSVEEAYTGTRRTISVPTPTGLRRHDVSIPAGVTDGQRIRRPRRGRAGQPGDLYLVVRLAPHPRYRVQGRNVTVDLPITPWEAALGATVPVLTPAGTQQVEVPAGSTTGRRLRLPGRGLPNPDGAAGDLYAEVKIMIPGRPSPAERHLYQRLAATSTFNPRRTATTAGRTRA